MHECKYTYTRSHTNTGTHIRQCTRTDTRAHTDRYTHKHTHNDRIFSSVVGTILPWTEWNVHSFDWVQTVNGFQVNYCVPFRPKFSPDTWSLLLHSLRSFKSFRRSSLSRSCPTEISQDYFHSSFYSNLFFPDHVVLRGAGGLRFPSRDLWSPEDETRESREARSWTLLRPALPSVGGRGKQSPLVDPPWTCLPLTGWQGRLSPFLSEYPANHSRWEGGESRQTDRFSGVDEWGRPRGWGVVGVRGPPYVQRLCTMTRPPRPSPPVRTNVLN